jgi:undecaprenyl diphosphate synthase
VFIDTLWPDFTKADLERALSEFHSRERRYGAIAGRL